MLTKEQILSQLKKENVDLGKNPERTFVYYQELGLLPTQGKSHVSTQKRRLLFPDWTPKLIKTIKRLQREGKKLKEIKTALGESQSLTKTLKKVLGLEPNEEIALYINYAVETEMTHCVVGAFYRDRIKWFKIEGVGSPWDVDEDLAIADSKTLNYEEYGELVKNLAIKVAKEEQRTLTEKDINLMVFTTILKQR